MDVTIRPAKPADTQQIAAFNNAMAEETENRSLATEVITPGVSALLHNAENGRYWVAESDGRIVGQIMVTYEWSDWRNGMMWWIQSVYVQPNARRTGVFTALYRHVETLAQNDAQCCGIRLYVEQQNRRAMQTYESLGMSKPGYEVMQVEFSSKETSISQGAK